MHKISCFFAISLFFIINFCLAVAAEQNVTKRFHIVQNGENVYRIAIKYNIKQQDLLDANNLKNTNVWVGQKLILPANARFPDDEKSKAIAKDEPINENLNKIANTENIQNQNLINQLSSTTFIWPSRGVILSKFGHKTKTGRLEGVNIGGETGSIVRASSSGEVVYSNSVTGYGNVIIVRHYNGFFTAYGYVEPLVAVGDKIKKGQVIAHMAKNSQSKRSQLYFSIRKNGQSYDPEKIILTKISD